MSNDLINEAKRLKNSYKFDEALDILNGLDKKDPDYYRLKAECYYQDLKISTKKRFIKPLQLLKINDDNKPQETLRLTGAIYKRKYQYTKDIKDLHSAIRYYEQAAKDVEEDMGYGAGNTIYLYYLLLNDFGSNLDVHTKTLYQFKAFQLIEKHINYLEELPKNKLKYWQHASLASLYLGKSDVDNAKKYIEKYLKAYFWSCKKELVRKYKHKSSYGKDKDKKLIQENPKLKYFDRELVITAQQMIEFFNVLPFNLNNRHILDILEPYTQQNLKYFDNDINILIDSVRVGKIGLALSGGGFRASLYHIGILMRLAELDLLRHVQAISTVSGGSIIGMMYYLMLEEKFKKGDGQNIDYVQLIQTLREKFVAGIQENIRMKAFDKESKTPLTQRLGELYQEILYDTIEGDIPILMNDIAITPKGFDSFNPHFHNFILKNKVPRIIVNATLLNNGHNWQFTTEGMGENSYMYDRTIDKNASYPFKQYSKICGDITIGEAIASSSAVPTLFDPVAFDLLADTEDCQTKVREGKLQICDGGVYDNLGLASLVNDECTHIIISDGSKQMTTDHEPSTFRLDVLNRTNDMLMTKNRDAEYRFANHLKNQGIVKGLAISHMKEDIEETKLACLLNKVASIRTDLDAFNDVEAYAIMYSGYKITSMQFENEELKKSFDIKEGIPLADEFNTFELYYEKNQSKTLKMIDKSSKTLFKAITYVRLNLLWSICACLTLLMILWFYFFPKILLSFLILIFILFKIEKKWLKLGSNKILGVVMKCISRYYLKYINQKYLDSGKMK